MRTNPVACWLLIASTDPAEDRACLHFSFAARFDAGFNPCFRFLQRPFLPFPDLRI
jgi:hypothetical protein